MNIQQDQPDDHSHPVTFDELITPGKKTLRRLWLPFVLIQLCGCVLVAGYYFVPAVMRACEWIGSVKSAGGYLFCAGVMSIAGGLMPEVFKYISGVDRSLSRKRLNNIGFAMCLFAWTGMVAESFYQLLAWLLGDSNSPGIISAKVLIDQFIYTPTLGMGFIAFVYAWRRENYRLIRLLRQINVRWYLRTAGPLLFPCWAYWIPMCVLLYALPVSLQFIFGAIGMSAANLIFIAVASQEKQ
jgi:hypothetical protein